MPQPIVVIDVVGAFRHRIGNSLETDEKMAEGESMKEKRQKHLIARQTHRIIAKLKFDLIMQTEFRKTPPS
jgi:hypothetical protein